MWDSGYWILDGKEIDGEEWRLIEIEEDWERYWILDFGKRD